MPAETTDAPDAAHPSFRDPASTLPTSPRTP